MRIWSHSGTPGSQRANWRADVGERTRGVQSWERRRTERTTKAIITRDSKVGSIPEADVQRDVRCNKKRLLVIVRGFLQAHK